MVRRRHFLKLPPGGALLVYSLDGEPLLQTPAGEVQVPLRFFTSDEAAIVEAAVSRIFPSDDTGPGAKECGVTLYIDRQLAGPYGRDRYRYTKEPFEAGSAEQGYQGKSTPREIYRTNLKSLAGLASLSEAEQDNRLRAIENTAFFRLLRQHTLEGMFCDPMHGGNRDCLGWQLIGFPGPYMSWANDIDRHYGETHRVKSQSISQILNRKVVPWEELEP
ncbi:MAG: gluconate 2-dehydrogenase subunit 3 family protein [Acidobacteria bacterium]|nr:gluconate 2-dehydrogenase subunit 3 family protein [Acidobacteriota bacterium]